MKLFEITEQYKAVLSLVENGEIPYEEAVDTLESIAGDSESKLKACGAAYLNRKSDIESAKAHIKTIQERIKKMESANENLSRYALSNMQTMGILKVETPLFSLSLNKSKSVSVEVDLDKLSEDFLVRKEAVSADKVAIKARLKAGGLVDGAHLVKSDTLTIK